MATDSPRKIFIKEELKRKSLTAPRYPIDLGSLRESKYTAFLIYKYNKPDINRVELKDTLGAIFLPIPIGLSNSDVLSYKEFSAPILSGVVKALQSDSVEDASNALGGAGAAALKSVLGTNKLTGNIANQIAALSGASVNPRNTNIFETPVAREHRFSFKMIAKSLEESIAIRQIISKFRYHAYQGTGESESIFWAPDLFDISFHVGDDADEKNTFLFRPLPSALTSMSVMYNGESAPTFFKNSNAPVEVQLSLTFKEMELDSKDKLNERYETITFAAGEISGDTSTSIDANGIRPSISQSTTSGSFTNPTNIRNTLGPRPF